MSKIKISPIEYLRKRIFGSKYNVSGLDSIDTTINNISRSILNRDISSSMSNVKKTISSAFDDENFSDMMTKLVSENFVSTEEKDRCARYRNADEIWTSLPYCSRALKVLTDEIISPNEVTKESLQIYTESDSADSSDDDEIISTLKSVNNSLDIEDILPDVVHDNLKYGDYFIEIVDETSESKSLAKSVISEYHNSKDKILTKQDVSEIEKKYSPKTIDMQYVDIDDESKQLLKEGLLNRKNIKKLNKSKNLKLSFEVIDNPEILKDKKKNTNIDISSVSLVVHSPSTVIKIQSRRFKTCLGYIILPETNTSGTDVSSQFYQSQLLNKLGVGYSDTGIDQLYKELIKHVEKIVGHKDDLNADEREVKKILQTTLADLNNPIEEFKVRYVPEGKMIHFALNKNKYFPYGEGIFERILFQAKLLIAMETAVTVKRVSDSSDKRIFYVEYTNRDDIRNTIESIKQEFNKRTFSVDSWGSISAIPTMITSFEDIYIPQKNGKRYLELDRMDSPTDIRTLTDELKFYRDMVIAGLDVPPSFISLEENVSNRTTLSQESIVFAKTVVSYQKYFSKFIFELFNKIYFIIKGHYIPNQIIVTLPPPKLLQVELQSNHINNVVSLIENLERIGISKEVTKRMFLSLDWDSIDKIKNRERIKDKIVVNRDDEDGQSSTSGGGYGGF